ncbi:MAG: response regulator, partial [Leptolyngbya sp. SIO1D8]|nr:response regulator [Leptolyngbya sp. SIO1D8]
ARNGGEAIALAQSEIPDLILIDLQLPEVNGLEVTRQIRRHSDLMNAPIIALSALDMPSDQEHFLAAGANYYLSKPVKLKQLVITIQETLDAQKACDKMAFNLDSE